LDGEIPESFEVEELDNQPSVKITKSDSPGLKYRVRRPSLSMKNYRLKKTSSILNGNPQYSFPCRSHRA
jgi:hypothetical protein